MRIPTAFPTLSVLIIVLAGALFGHGWGQALPFATGASNADYLSAPFADDSSLRPDTTRIFAVQSGDESESGMPALLARPAPAWLPVPAGPVFPVSNAPASDLPHRFHAPRAPPFA